MFAIVGDQERATGVWREVMVPAGARVTELVAKEQRKGPAAVVVVTERGAYQEAMALAKEPARRHGRQRERQRETRPVKPPAKGIASGAEEFRPRDFAPARESRK